MATADQQTTRMATADQQTISKQHFGNVMSVKAEHHHMLAHNTRMRGKPVLLTSYGGANPDPKIFQDVGLARLVRHFFLSG